MQCYSKYVNKNRLQKTVVIRLQFVNARVALGGPNIVRILSCELSRP